jgi:hypothetical protein
VRALAQLEQEVELLGEQLVVVLEVMAEEGEGLDERPPAGHDLGPTARHQVDGREVLEDADGVRGAQHGHRAREPDALRAHRGRPQHHRRGRDGEVGAVVLADAEDVESDLLGEDDLLHEVAHALLRARARGYVGERRQPELHGGQDSDGCARNDCPWPRGQSRPFSRESSRREPAVLR